MTTYAPIRLRAGREHSVRRFHPWVFSGALDTPKNPPKEGDLVNICSQSGEYLATGYYSTGSIAVRIISYTEIENIQVFLASALKRAYQLREKLGLTTSSETNAYRLFNAEGDGIPGLIIDIYASVAVVQFHSKGVSNWSGQIVKELQNLFGSALEAVFDRSPEPGKESSTPRMLLGKAVPVSILEHGLQFSVDCVSGQKTGFYLDQRENRLLLQSYANGKRVLNAFSYTGGFTVYALRGGAASVCSVDASQASMEQLEKNVGANMPGAEHRTLVRDCLEYLPRLNESFDLIILDPPAFVKHQGALKGGLKGYESINLHAFSHIAPGGIVFTFSCSQFVDRTLFLETVTKAGIRAGRQIRVLHELTQAPCHPMNLFHPEGLYLKGLVLEVA